MVSQSQVETAKEIFLTANGKDGVNQELLHLYRGQDGVRRMGTMVVTDSLEPTQGNTMPEYDKQASAIVVHTRKPVVQVW